MKHRDIVIMDINIPIMNGLKDIFLTGAIRAERNIRNGVHALLFCLCGVRHHDGPGSYKSDTILCKIRLFVKQVFLYDMSED